jgi:DNA-binding transcriptional LysR family regulator
MSDRLQELAVFVRAAESGSFSKAARELGLSQPSVSRIIGDLETRLGVKLLLRTTRRITATDAGALFLTRAREVLSDIEDAEDAARGIDSLRGTIRITMPVMYGSRNIIPRLPKFLAAHPLLRVELSVVDERQDLVAEGTDVAIRLGLLNDSGFGVRSLGILPRLVVASPSYLAIRGAPKTPADLASHDCIFGPGQSGRTSWSFTRNGTETSVDVRGRIASHGRTRDRRRHAGPPVEELQAFAHRRLCRLPGWPPPLDQSTRSGGLSRNRHETDAMRDAPDRSAGTADCDTRRRI